ESVKHLDAAITRLGFQESLSSDFFPLIVAYAGEVIRRAVEGEWTARLNEEHGVWEPYVVGADGGWYDPWWRPAKALSEEEGHLYIVVWCAITAGGDPPPSEGEGSGGDRNSVDNRCGLCHAPCERRVSPT